MANNAVADVRSVAQEVLSASETVQPVMARAEEPAEYLVDNSRLRANAPGIAFRFSKRHEDRDDLGELAAFGDVLLGIEEGDGWLRVQNPKGEIRYLPMEIQGILVMSRTAAEEQRGAREDRLRKQELAHRKEKDLEAWHRRSAEAERQRRERLQREEEKKTSDAKVDELNELLRQQPKGFAGRGSDVLKSHYAGEEEETPDHYQVLGVARRASQEEIAQAYRALVKLYHPDRLASSAGTLSKAAAQRAHEQRMAALNAAYRVLSDTRLRWAYDRSLPDGQDDVDAAEAEAAAAAEGSGKPEDGHDFDFMGPDRPYRCAKGRAARAAKACGSREHVRHAMEIADKDGQIRPSGPLTPFGGLGECADPDCPAHRLAWPQIRTRFRDFVVGKVRRAVRGEDGGPWWNPEEGLRYTSIGSGQLLLDLEIIERIRFVGVRIAQICLVDTAYGGCPPPLDTRRALREFTDWQRAAAQLCRHEPADVVVFSEVWDYYETCCQGVEPNSKAGPDAERFRKPCDLMVHCDATWPGGDEECEQLALASLSAGGLYARLSSLASKADDDSSPRPKAADAKEGTCNRRGHSLAPLVARAWTLSAGDVFTDPELEARGYSPSAPSGPSLVELEQDDLLDFCRGAIDDATHSEPKYDLQLARILADARESSRRAAATGDQNNAPVNRNSGFPQFDSHPEPGRDYGIQLRKEQPPKKYFEERRTAKSRVPGKGPALQRGVVFEDPVFSQPDDLDITPPKPKPKSKAAQPAGLAGRAPAMADPVQPLKSPQARGLTPWKVVCSPHVAVRAKPKATAKLVGQIYTGETVFVKEEECAGAWLRVYEAPGHELPADAWMLSDATEFGTGILLKRVDGPVRS
eukprot:TRINITY_DN19317_c0_g1_i2.p1 TRINITY_DN19317_c0_g1~~TRINITY_DN19317_c0_g1_i2.p1  ORF type:complete len:948 (+),score=158.98 TRINITY_DN19317_c0_g1_i2:256-2844(+)